MHKQLSFFALLFALQSSALRGKGRQADCLGLQNRALQMAIRHYGLLANCQGPRLALARAALNMPAPSPVATECAQAFMQRVAQAQIRQCPACGHGRLVVVQVLLGARQLPVPGQAGCGPSTCHTRGPPP